MAFALTPTGDPVLVSAVGEGALLGAYRFDRFRTTYDAPAGRATGRVRRGRGRAGRVR